MNRQKKIRQKLIKKAKAANAKANPKKRSEYVTKAEREKTNNDTGLSTKPSTIS